MTPPLASPRRSQRNRQNAAMAAGNAAHMDRQLALFEPLRARRTDPLTSHQAAEQVKHFAANHHGIILFCLQEHGPRTISEIARLSGLEVHAVARRTVELQRQGAIRVQTKDGAEQTRAGPSGRQQRVWECV